MDRKANKEAIIPTMGQALVMQEQEILALDEELKKANERVKELEAELSKVKGELEETTILSDVLINALEEARERITKMKKVPTALSELKGFQETIIYGEICKAFPIYEKYCKVLEGDLLTHQRISDG